MEFNILEGKTIREIKKKADELIFVINKNEAYVLYHDQDCCETVEIEDICGDLNDLIGIPVIRATEDTNDINDEPPDGIEPPRLAESYTWTFYNIATKKGHVTIRWLGESNGYYSESVDFKKLTTLKLK